MNKKPKVLLIAFFILCLSFSSAWASRYEITYDRTFTADEIQTWFRGMEFYGISVGPAPVHVSFTLDTDAAPVRYFPAGYATLYGATLHDLYVYDSAAVSNLVWTFGNKTWTLDDLYVSNFSVATAPLWIDRVPVDGGTANLALMVEDEDGSCQLDALYLQGGGMGMIRDGRVMFEDTHTGFYLFGNGGVVSIHETASVPEPGVLILLVFGLFFLPALKRMTRR